ncbi:hypothetical protein D9757_003318 [Collybiopsis confluens]|uniref:Uncharacterized protein n=1 Tax=Collybiopsis confluens TaxID=2823264 RepID=A0A8H5HZ27_9AGAR|nr:hypothetical protein D9757_003318 [Collybiopsis confluens]
MDAFPQEILSEIAIYTASLAFLGPPSPIIPLLTLNRWIHSCLSMDSNPYIYAKIYQAKFDLSPALRRLKVDSFSSTALAQELRRKCLMLKRIRSSKGATTKPGIAREEEWLSEFLFQIYLMMLEDEGNNRLQLVDYARMDKWLQDYWFDDFGASGSWQSIKNDLWPVHSESNCLAMWLLWFLFDPEQYQKSPHTRKALGILKIFSLGAHLYPLVTPSWLNFLPPPSHGGVSQLTPLYDESTLSLKAPALTPPAVLCFFSLLINLPQHTDYSPLVPSRMTLPRPEVFKRLGNEWEYEWGRSTNLGTTKNHVSTELKDVFRPGSIDGIWEGIFMYTDFTSYASLLSGSHPGFLQNMLVGHQMQRWELREFHLYSQETVVKAISAGSALHTYFPRGTSMEETPQGLKVTEPGHTKKPVMYTRFVAPEEGEKDRDTSHEEEDRIENETRTAGGRRRLIDIIVKGEGHAPWGGFSLVGRVRPRDGFVSLLKNYSIDGESDREKWLYRGYIVGNHNPNISGRWRETLTPPERPASYEGCFTMSRVGKK